MNVETLLPILASTLRDIFVILGVILIFQMIVLAYLKRHHLHGGDSWRNRDGPHDFSQIVCS